MKFRILEFAIKCIITISLLLLVVQFLVLIFNQNPNISPSALLSPLIIMSCLFVVFLALNFIIAYVIPPTEKKNAIKPEKHHTNYENFDALHSKLLSILERYQYKLCDTYNISNGELYIYCQKDFWIKRYFVLVRTDNLTEFLLNEINDIFKEKVTKESRISLMSLICVNRVSPIFYKFLEEFATSSISEVEVRTGYSFGGNTLYIANSPIGIGVAEKKKLKKILLESSTIRGRFYD